MSIFVAHRQKDTIRLSLRCKFVASSNKTKYQRDGQSLNASSDVSNDMSTATNLYVMEPWAPGERPLLQGFAKAFAKPLSFAKGY